jgi:spore coat protein H
MASSRQRPFRSRLLAAIAVLLLGALVAAALLHAQTPSAPHPAGPARPPAPASDAVADSKTARHRKEIDDFFKGSILILKFDFEPEEWENLKKDHRRYAECRMSVLAPDGKSVKTYKGVAVKLKGSAGSFRGPDDQPGLTISLNKFKGAERFHGMSKFHLNNGVQDPTFLREAIAGEMGRMAGVPVSRCTHALVSWKDRKPALYVFKEAFTKEFFPEFFKGPAGSLYDGGAGNEIGPNLEKDEGDPVDRADIKELLAACQEPDASKRWPRLEKSLDVDRFISFLAMESILCHWDGYNFARNNYRVYFDGQSKRAAFFLHGLDQTFGDPNFPVLRDPGATVGQVVLSNPEWKARYRERSEQIYETVLKPIDWGARVEALGEKVRAALAAQNEQKAKEYVAQVKATRQLVENRIAAVGKQLAAIPKPFKFDPNGFTKVDPTGWRKEGSGAEAAETQVDGKPALHIHAIGESSASWRKNLALPAGRYRLQARARTAGVVSPPDQGAGLRISGANRATQNAATGDTPWKELQFEFDAPGGDVVLVAELKASKGDAWFDRESFQLLRLK